MKIRNIFAAAAVTAMVPCTLMLSGATAGEAFLAAADITRRTAYLSAGVDIPQTEEAGVITSAEADEPPVITHEAPQKLIVTESAEPPQISAPETDEPQPTAQVMSQNIIQPRVHAAEQRYAAPTERATASVT